MARTTQQIFDEIEAAKIADAHLNGLTSTSATAIWKLWAYVVAFCTHTLEVLWDAFREEVEELASLVPPGTDRWYVAKLFEFQYGYPIVWMGFVPTYATDDPAARIIKAAAIQQQPSGIVLFKVAKNNGGTLGPLSGAEVTALEAYVDDIKFAGTRTQILTLNPDNLKIDLEIFYDPIFDLNAVKTAVELAINTYLANLPFNAEILSTAIQDAAQSAEGVHDVIINSIEADTGSGYASIGRSYIPVAGYVVIDSNFPLSATLTYTPNI